MATDISASEIKEIFMLFDKNADGYVYTTELGTLVRAINLNPTENELVELCKRIDPQNTGQFSLQQLEEIIRQRGRDPDSLQDVIDALKVFDSDHDGKISIEEFLYAMTNMGERMSEEEVKEIVSDSDIDEGKFIKVDEFARMIMNRI